MNLKAASRIFFALTTIAIGAMGLLQKSFAPIWLPVPDDTPFRTLLPHLCTLVSLACGAGLLLKRAAPWAALVLFAYLLIWAVVFKFPFIVRAPLVEGSYQSFGENAVQIAGAWILYVWLASGTKKARLGFLSGDWGLWLARLLYGLALVAFGLSHFAYLNLTAPLVPKWLPDPVLWAYLTGGIYLAAGLSVITGFAARLGTVGVAVQITLITVLVWGPFVLGGHVSADNWQETVVSWAIAAGAWVVAASYEGQPWFGRRFQLQS